MTNDELSELEKIALAATPGPWVYSPDRFTHDCLIHQDVPVPDQGYFGPYAGGVVGSSEWTWLSDANAAFISRFNPATVLRLIHALRQASIRGGEA